MKVKQELKLHNRFDIEVRDAKTGELKQQAYAENIVLNSFWAHVLSSNLYVAVTHIHVGTGSGTLSASRNSLFSFLGAKSASGGTTYDSDYEAGWVSVRYSAQITESEYVGQTITEIGVASGTGSTTLETHAMLKDMNGNPVSLLKTATDIVTLYATLYCVFNPNGWDSGALKVIPAKEYLGSFFLRCLGSAGWNQFNRDAKFTDLLFPVFNIVTGIYNYYSQACSVSFDVPSKKMTVYVRLPASSGNWNGIRSVSIMKSFMYAPYYSQVLAGREIIGEQIAIADGVGVDFKTKYPKVSLVKIYVDGIEQASGVTTDKTFASNDLAPEMQIIETTHENMFIGSTSGSSTINKYMIFENPYYNTLGIDKITSDLKINIYAADSLDSWELVFAGGIGKSVPATFRSKRYWKFLSTANVSSSIIASAFISNDLPATIYNIHFDTPPPSGSVITADYTTDVLPKDSDHVFDLTLEFQFGEYTP